LTGANAPSIVTLRLASARVERVNAVLENVLPLIEEDVRAGALVTVEDHGIRRRSLPLAQDHMLGERLEGPSSSDAMAIPLLTR
jgi:hypothetical protein